LFAADNSQDFLAQLSAFFNSRQCAPFLVGGYLRDSLLSIPSNDIDIAVPGEPQELGQALAQLLAGTYISLSRAHSVCRIVSTDQTGQQWNVDLAGFTGSIEEDLARRDFTVDSLALPLDSRSVEHWMMDSGVTGQWRDAVIDPTGGIADLAHKRIRVTNSQVFEADPGRLLRAVRLASRLQFRIDPETTNLIRSNAHRIENVSPERVRDEFLSILAGDNARSQLEILDRLDLLCRVIPELAITKGVEQPIVHYWDVWGHSIHAVETAELVTKGHQNSAIYSQVPWTQESVDYFGQQVSDGHTRRTILKLTALLHDIAKPQTKAKDATGRTRFLGHSEMGAEIAEERLSNLRLSSRGIAMVSKMVEQHLRPTNMNQGVDLPTNRAIYRYFRDLGDVAIDTLYLAMADYLAAKGPEVLPDDWARHAKMMTHILLGGTDQTKPDRPARLITGHDLIQQFNLNPSPQIGVILEHINEAQAAGEVSTREQAMAMAAEFLNRQNDPSQFNQE
jgi:poly(A) polymerase